MTKLHYDGFVRELYNFVGIGYRVEEGYAYSTCNADFPNIYFAFDTTWL